MASLDAYRRHGFTVNVRVHCKEDGTHRVDVKLEKVIEELPFKGSILAASVEREVEVVRRLHDQKWLIQIQPKEKEEEDS